MVEGKKFDQPSIRGITDRKRAEEALQASETRYRRLFEAAQDGILILNAETGQIDDVNPYMIDMLHYSHEEFLGKKLWEVSPFKDTIVNRAAFEELQDKGYIRYKDLPLETKEGKHIAVEFVSNVYKANGNKAIQCNIRNITERKNSEEELQISETRYRRLFESAQDGILILDADTGQVIDANPFMQDLLGYSCEEFVGKTLWDIGSFKDIAASKSSFDELQRKGYVRYEDLPIETSDGRHINVEFVSNVYMVDGKQVIQCNIHDITARKRSEEALREAHDRAEWLALFPEENPNPVMRVSANGSILYCNPASVKIPGWTCKDDQRLPDPLVSLFGDAMTVGQEIQQDVELGEQFYSIAVVPIAEKGYANVYGRNITDRKQADEEARKVLLEKNEEIRAMTQQLWQTAKLATMGELSASIAHELNNPLATVSLRVESLLEKTPEDNSNHRELGIIEQEVERMSKLIANLLQFSRRGQQQISTVDICEEIEKTLELIHYHLRKNNIVIRREFVQDVPPVHADRQQLRQLFLNLFTNASDAMPQGGTLAIRVIAPPESMQVIMEVADTGTGIPPEILPKVAEPFYTTKPEGEGTGLGLAICRRIVEEHSGTFDLVSEGIPGKGTTARISLPVKNRYGFSQPEKSLTEANVRSKG